MTVNKYRFYICPVNVASYETTIFLKTFFMCEKLGCLPYNGSLFEQDNLMVDAFEIINAEISKHENSQLEKSKKDINTKNGN